MDFDVRLYQDEDSVWIAECPVIPGCVSQGETLKEVKKNILDALEGCLAVAEELAKHDDVFQEMEV